MLFAAMYACLQVLCRNRVGVISILGFRRQASVYFPG